jgi:hypothetical protein
MVGREPSQIAREAEAKLGELHGVLDARITLGSRGEVIEVHVVADSSRRGKELVRDIETVLRASFDLDVDHRRISVARVRQDELMPVGGLATGRRVRLAGVGLHLADGSGQARVDLVRSGLDASGSASGSSIGESWLRLVAGATLQAVTRFLPPGSAVVLNSLSRAHIGPREVVIVGVDYVADHDARELVGCAFLNSDLQRAVAHATLDAVNRVMGKSDLQAETVTFLEPPL